MKINKITLHEHCFGSSFQLNENVNFDNEDSKDIIIKELSTIKDELSESEWVDILEIIAYKKFKYTKKESNTDTCEQCGNWNSTEVYEKLNIDN